ncbi:Uncharacterised protein [Mycolicibacterium phlei]|uniref:hypothetical protein n=1 Tax=Mycobacteroides chelonae TaxID=1774 RepID=UPI000ADF6E8C|nr:hypothetical protein [Mycobacteroides chelonae]VEG16087.1 Uncharacterised protein [Mycolicibacterium phlei]
MANELAEETREALLTAIKSSSETASAAGLQQLAMAFALTVGAARTRLPGYTPPSSS